MIRHRHLELWKIQSNRQSRIPRDERAGGEEGRQEGEGESGGHTTETERDEERRENRVRG